MKKLRMDCPFVWEDYVLTLKKMKLTCLILFLFCLSGWANSYSQNTKLNLKFRNAPVQEIIQEIENQTGFYFLYRDEIFPKDKKVTIEATDDSLDKILQELADQTDIYYEVTNSHQIVLKKKEKGESLFTEQQNLKTIRGVVLGQNGVPIPGVTIVVKNNTNIGTITNSEGEYTITKVPEGAVLSFSFVGMKTQELSVAGKSLINVTMEEETLDVGEVVAVGFGTQRKESMVSSVTTINAEELKTSSSNLTTALSGKISGMIAYQRSGEPGEDNAEFFIRGLGTFGSGKVDPLILIDGIESSSTDMARLQPDDIESFSVLKDATAAAVYGARGANGVVLITTKTGRAGKTKFDFRFENKISGNTRNFKLTDNITYMTLANEAALTRDPNAVLPYTQSKINHTVAGDNPLLYPDNNWIDQLIKDFTVNQSYNMSVSGGSPKARYYVAGTYTVDNGVLKVDPINNFNSNIKLRNYSVRTNVNLNLTKTTEAIIRMYAQFDDYNGPIGGGKATFNRAIWSNPVKFPAVYPSSLLPYVKHPLFGGAITGKGSTTLLTNPYAEMVKGYQVYKTSSVQPQFEVKQDLSWLVPGLKARAMAYIKRYSYFQVSRYYNPFYYSASLNPADDSVMLTVLNDGGTNSVGTVGTEYLTYNEGDKTINSQMYLETAMNYNRTFSDKHEVSGMLVMLMSSYQTGNAGSVQLSLPEKNFGVSGRFTYGYDKRYMAEFNFGYNGSEKFADNHRFGFFPSFGVAYNISNEKFFEPWKNVISDLKLRATYGLIGNDAIGDDDDRFFYLSDVNLDNSTYGATFGEDWGYSRNGVSVSRYANYNISWEKSKQINLGIDLQLYNSLDFVFEIYKQKRTNILQNRSYVGSTMGLTATPQSNYGEAQSKGIDVMVSYNKSFSSGWYTQLRGNFTYAASEVLKYDEVTYPENQVYRYHKGNSISQTYGYIAERLFVDDAEVENAPSQFGEYMGGDIKYRDMNGDGAISEADRVPIGLPTTPEIVYGFGGTVGYKRFDFSAFFQGEARTSFFINAENISPFVINGGAQNGLLEVIANDYWSEDNRDLYAFWPRLSDYFVENNNQTSTWWMRNGSFLRLKSVEIGYNAPDRALQKFRIKALRFYVSATNLFVISKFKLWDPEMGGSGLGYPIQRVYNMGLTISL
jgi:TonB-linked SusC/RagA family outer membrane protein